MNTNVKSQFRGLTAFLVFFLFLVNGFSAYAQNVVEVEPQVLETTIMDGQTSTVPFTITNNGSEALSFIFPGYESTQSVASGQNFSQIIESNLDHSELQRERSVLNRYFSLNETNFSAAEREIIDRFEQRSSEAPVSTMSGDLGPSYDIVFENLELQGGEFLLVDEISISGDLSGFAGDFTFLGGTDLTWASDLTILFTTEPEFDPENPETAVFQIGGSIHYVPSGFSLPWGVGNSDNPGTTVDVGYILDPSVEIEDLYVWIGNGWTGEGTWSGTVSFFGLSAQPLFITSLDPAEGVIAQGESVSVDATFDADGYNAGTFNGNLRMMLTGSEETEQIIPAVMNVSEMLALSVEPSSLDFGDVFVGQTKNLTVSIVNTGNTTLEVSDFEVDNSTFSIPISGTISVGPSMSIQIAIAFTPASSDDFEGEFTFSTTVPDAEVLTVPLVGSGVPVPVFSVNPLDFELSLDSGESTTFDITISNEGESDLLFSIPRFDTEEALLGNTNLIQSMQQRAPFIVSEENLNAINNRNLVERYRAGLIEDFSAEAATILSEMNRTTEGYEINQGTLSLSPGKIIEFEDFEISGGHFIPATGALSGGFEGVTADFVLNFGFSQTWASDLTLLVTSTPELDLGDYDSVLLQIGGTIAYSAQKFNWGMGNSDSPGTAVNTTLEFIPPQEVEEVYFWIGNGWAEFALGSWSGEIELHGLGGADSFITNAAPSSGSVAPGSSQTVTLDVSADGLIGGSYLDRLTILSNDLNTSSAQITGTIFVSGIPDISVPEGEIDFGTVFTGGNTSEGLIVTNSGTDILEISSVTSDSPDFLVDNSEFSLSPGESTVVEIVLAPTNTGTKSGTLTILSNAESGDVTVSLVGEVVNPGILSADSENFSFELNQGENDTATVILSNTGESDLEYSISSFAESGSESLSVKAGNAPAKAKILHDFMAVGKNASQSSGTFAINENSDIIWDQPATGFNAVFSTHLITDVGAYGADSFILENSAAIGFITAYGASNSFFPPEELDPFGATFYVYEDNNGAPAGIPKDGNENHIFKFEAAPGADGFSKVFGENNDPHNITLVLDINEATGANLQLDSGKYWLVVFVNGAQSNEQDDSWFWRLGASDKSEAVFVDPDDIFNLGATDWVNIEPFVGLLGANFAFTLQGVDVNFLSFNPVAGVIAPGESVEITLLADANGLQPGEYFADMVIITNSPTTPELTIPVSLFVNEAEAGVLWANLHYPSEVTIDRGEDFMIHGLATVVEEMQAHADEMVRMWVGFHTSNVHPGLWEEEVWVEGHFHQQHDDISEFIVNTGSHLPAGEHFYAVRFQMEGHDYVYGGFHQDGGGFWSEGLHVSGRATVMQSTSTVNDNEVPVEFALRQNYPNPFNPATIISYDLPESSDVRLEVFNIQGQRVATLVNANQSAGTYSVNFDASRLSSGVYIYRIQAGNFIQTQKMTLVK